MSARARIVPGSAIRLSTTRWLARSTKPPKYAVTMPHSAPSVMPTVTETRPT
jgi:hypothetical protein